MQHFDILYIGNDPHVWKLLQDISKNFDFSVLQVLHISDLKFIYEDISFTFVLSELHIDFNYEGFSVDKIGLKCTYLITLVDELDEASIIVGDYIFGNQDKYLLLKDEDIIYSFLTSRLISINQNRIPIEA